MAKGGKQRPYYGYVIVTMSFFILLVMWSCILSFGVFVKPLEVEFGWSRTMTSGAYSLCMILLGLLFIVAGRLNDRFGPRLVVTIGSLFGGLGFISLYWMSSLWQLYLFFGVMIAIGASVGYVPLSSTVARWFVNKRGLMTGIVLSGSSLGTVLGPMISTHLIASYGVQTSFLILGLVTLTLIPIFAQFLKRDPGEKNVGPLGSNQVTEETSSSFSIAALSKPFWFFFIISICYGMSEMAILVHIVPHATDMGLPLRAAVSILTVIGLGNIVGRIGLGGIGDKIGSGPALVVNFVLVSIAMIMLLFAKQLWILSVFGVLYGLGIGGLATLISIVAAELFGMKRHGMFLGIFAFAGAIGNAGGPFLAGFIYDTLGSYQVAFVVLIAFGVLGIIISSKLVRRQAPAESQLPLHHP